MKPACQLDDFDLTALNVRWHELGEDSEWECQPVIDFELYLHPDDPEKFMVTMAFTVDPMELPPRGYEIKAEIRGQFRVPANPEAKLPASYIASVNGLTILYGILRGQIAQVTGAFPGDKFILPTVMMQDVVAHKAKTRLEEDAAASEPGPPKKAKSKKQTTKKKATRAKGAAKASSKEKAKTRSKNARKG